MVFLYMLNLIKDLLNICLMNYVICICRGNISPDNEILTRVFKSEKRLFTKRSKMHRFTKGDLSEQSWFNRADQH